MKRFRYDSVRKLEMDRFPSKLRLCCFPLKHKFEFAAKVVALFGIGRGVGVGAAVCGSPLLAQQAGDPPTPAVVQPGAPGEPTKTLPASTHATLPPLSAADVEFMQGMIMHHSQAVEMTALIESHT